MSRSLQLTLSGILLGVVSSSFAAEAVPLYLRNDNPFIAVYGMPHPMAAALPPAGEARVSFNLNISNNSISASDAGEGIVLDAETWRWSLGYAHALNADWGFEAELPYVKHQGASLDGFIRNWHDLLGLSNSERDKFDDGAMDLRYIDNGVTRVALANDVGGLGDIRLGLVHRIWEGEAQRDQRLVGRIGVKLPTGDEQELLGSGATDLYASLDGVDQQTFSHWSLAYWTRIGILYLGEGDILADRQKDVVFFGGGGFGWSPWAPLELKAQLELQSAFYDSALEQLGDASTQITLGGSLRLAEGWYLDGGVVEQFVTDTTPDVIFHLALRQGF